MTAPETSQQFRELYAKSLDAFAQALRKCPEIPSDAPIYEELAKRRLQLAWMKIPATSPP